MFRLRIVQRTIGHITCNCTVTAAPNHGYKIEQLRVNKIKPTSLPSLVQSWCDVWELVSLASETLQANYDTPTHLPWKSLSDYSKAQHARLYLCQGLVHKTQYRQKQISPPLISLTKKRQFFRTEYSTHSSTNCTFILTTANCIVADNSICPWTVYLKIFEA